MSGDWERRRILIWGKTRPEVSRQYHETVCTGGVFDDDRTLVRLYPIPLRFLDDEHVFKKYQWITADVRPAGANDPRPESYRIRAESIAVGDAIDTGKNGDWRERAGWVLSPSNVVRSVEQLQDMQAENKTSLGVLKPKQIIQVTSEIFPQQERRELWAKFKAISEQLTLPIDDTVRTPKPLTPPDYRFIARFTCDDPQCETVHNFGILDWEVDALYSNLKQKYQESGAKQRVVEHLRDRLLDPKRDARFFLGNISSHPTNFTIVGLWYPFQSPPGLFDAG